MGYKKTGGAQQLTKELDTKEFVNYFMGKYIRENKSDCVIHTLPENNNRKVLFVIDMQKDFIDKAQPPSYYDDKGIQIQDGIQIGAFAVKDGKTCVDEIIKYLDEHKDKFDKIIFTRDLHDPKHCSFSNQGGVFPNHCVIGTEGSKFDPVIQEWIEKNKSDKVEVLFKGMHPNQDSFGAIEYDDKHRNKRQLGENCCNSIIRKNDSPQISSCSDIFTGCKKLNVKYDSNQWTFGQTYADISEQFEDIKIGDLLEDKDVYICGLAGDYCVRDTALNLADMRKSNSDKNVYVLHDLTRNAFIPISPKYEKAIFSKNERYGGKLVNPNFFEETKNKPITDYIFKLNANGVAKMLTLNELKKLNGNVPSSHVHFVTDVRQIIADYCEAGVKLYTGKKVGRLSLDYNVVNKNKKKQNQNEIIQERQRHAEKAHMEKMNKARERENRSKKIGGKRRRKTKKRHNKKTKRKVTKKRHHKKTKKRKVRKTKKNKTRKR